MNKHSKQARVLAWLSILLILCLIIYMLYCAFTGQNFFGSLYLVIVIPVIIWAIMFFAGLFHSDKDEDDDPSEPSDKQ